MLRRLPLQAAQAGRADTCRALLAAGADATRECVILATGESFGAAGARLGAAPRRLQVLHH